MSLAVGRRAAAGIKSVEFLIGTRKLAKMHSIKIYRTSIKRNQINNTSLMLTETVVLQRGIRIWRVCWVSPASEAPLIDKAIANKQNCWTVLSNDG